MNILLTNDDGIFSEGIYALAKSLSGENKIIIIAPDGNRSAFSHSLTIHKGLDFKKEEFHGFEAYSLSGTPVDCVKFAIHYFTDVKFDLVCSGINHGNNLGSDTAYSGTVSAGLEANYFGIPSIAFSNVGINGTYDFGSNEETIRKIFKKLTEIVSPRYTLNVNLPNGKPTGCKVAPLGRQTYSDNYVRSKDGSYMLVGYPLVCEQDEENDVPLSSKGFVTITPIIYDRTDYSALNAIKDTKFL